MTAMYVMDLIRTWTATVFVLEPQNLMNVGYVMVMEFSRNATVEVPVNLVFQMEIAIVKDM